MATSTSAVIKRAVIKTMRAATSLNSAVNGAFFERLAPVKVKYPLVTYNFLPAALIYDWGNLEIHVLVDVFAYDENPVNANTVDGLIAGALNEAALDLSAGGQTLLLCRRVADLSDGPDPDARGRLVWQVGGSYAIWSTQPLP